MTGPFDQMSCTCFGGRLVVVAELLLDEFDHSFDIREF